MLHLLKSYLQFLKVARKKSPKHSPFVSDLLTKCFYDKTKYPEYAVLKAYRKSLLQNTNTIEVTDFGAGSHIFKSNVRAVNQVAKNAGISPMHAELLFRIVRYFQPPNVLEIGTSLGLATCALATGNPSGKLTTLEGCAQTLEQAKSQFQDFKLNQINSVHTEFSSFLEQHAAIESYAFIYFDGNHSLQATIAYFEQLLPTTTEDSVWIFDDIHWSKDMETAWEMIQQHPKVTLTIDIFQWGIVFFRSDQKKEHLTIPVRLLDR